MCSKGTDVLVDDHDHRRDKVFALLFLPMSHKFFCLILQSIERILSIVFVLGYNMYRPVLAHAHRNGQLL